MIFRSASVGVALSALAACGPSEPGTIYASPPNPAAAYCESISGAYGIERGTCTLPDGTVVDAWDYYREAFADQ